MKRRKITLDLFDQSENKICSIYDSSIDRPGQASDVVISTQRNGWKELSFELADIVQDTRAAGSSVGYEWVGQNTEYNGDWIPNPIAEHLKADFRIRAVIDDPAPNEDGVDWFVISEPRISHNGFTKTMSVTAGHISQILKTKNLGLEFSDEEGNNIGTADQLLDLIIEGTGWTAGNVAEFREDDGSVKIRSLKAGAKTGAFNLIAKMCELFDAKPVYHGETRTIDILPLNPFSRPEDGSLPDVSAEDVIELHYGRNVKNVTRTTNTENLVTKLQAYGSWGDDVTGQCGIDECTHKVYGFESASTTAGTEYKFTITEGGIDTTLYFTARSDGNASYYIYSVLDPASRMYVYDKATETAYPVSRKKTQDEPMELTTAEPTEEINAFSFLMAFDYYASSGLLTDEMIQAIADYQVNAPEQLLVSTEKSAEFANGLIDLSEIIGTVDFCRLDIAGYGTSGGYVTLRLNKTEDHSDGVIYRTDYEKRKEKRFKWRITEALDDRGEPTLTGTSVLYIVHDTEPVTWDKVWLKAIDDDDDPSVLTLWTTAHGTASTDRAYLFSSNNINGYLGAYESADASTVESLESATKVVTEKHPVYFDKIAPSVPTELYAWWWQFFDNAQSVMWFCWCEAGDSVWKRVYLTDAEPTGTIAGGSYWFNWKSGVLNKYGGGAWAALTTQSEKRVGSVFSSVWAQCMTRDKYYKGQYDYYRINMDGTLPVGNYAFEESYGTYWLFTTEHDLHSGDQLEYSTSDKWINVTRNGLSETLEAKSYRFNSLDWFTGDLLQTTNIVAGGLDTNTGAETSDPDKYRTTSIRVYPNTVYKASSSVDVCFYDEKNGFRQGSRNVTTFTAPSTARYMRLSASSFDGKRAYADNWQSLIATDDRVQKILSVDETGGRLKSIPEFVKGFADLADELYTEKRAAADAAQAAVRDMDEWIQETLGDLYREGWWQKNDYVDGDEAKLYKDALDNLKEISKPDVKYSIGQLDLRGLESPETDIMWPDVSSTMAAHLIDPELNIDEWAFIDTVQKCYDKPWETKISINTNLTLMNQHTFSDVVGRIADVAASLSAKQTRYDKAVIKNGADRVAAETLQGKIDASTVKLTGGSSTWQTDEDGNMVFVSANNEGAMTLTGNGFMIANSKNKYGEWNWRTFGTSEGFIADEIVAGVLRAGAVTILGTDQFYWDANNIYIFDPTNSDRQIRIGQYDGVNYGIGFTQNNGETWQNAIGFDGVHFSFGGQDDITEALNAKADKEELNTVKTNLEANIAGIRASVESITSDEFIETLSQSVLQVTEGEISSTVSEIVSETTQTKEEVEERIGYRIEIISTSDILSDAIKTTTLTAHVQNGNRDVTTSFAGAPTRFSWKRVSSDSSGDTTWNNYHQGFGNVLTLSTADVYYSASYSCEFS